MLTGEFLVPGFFEEVVLTPALGKTEPWRFITSAFAHSIESSPGAGELMALWEQFSHITFNMLALYMLGRGLEVFLGVKNFLWIYLLSALAGGLAFVAMAIPPGGAATPLGLSWTTGVVGASGAVFGLFGALLIIQRVLRMDTSQIWVMLAINAYITFTIPGIAWQAHVGGFLIGMLTAWIIMRSAKRQAMTGQKSSPDLLLAAVGLGLVLLIVLKYALV